MKYMKFADMHQDCLFEDQHGRRFIKLQQKLPSGLIQKFRRFPEGSINGLPLNSVDLGGCAAMCPDYLEFKIITWGD